MGFFKYYHSSGGQGWVQHTAPEEFPVQAQRSEGADRAIDRKKKLKISRNKDGGLVLQQNVALHNVYVT